MVPNYHIGRNPIHIEKPYISVLVNRPTWVQPLSHPIPSIRNVNKEVRTSFIIIQPVQSHWGSHSERPYTWFNLSLTFKILNTFIFELTICKRNSMGQWTWVWTEWMHTIFMSSTVSCCSVNMEFLWCSLHSFHSIPYAQSPVLVGVL